MADPPGGGASKAASRGSGIFNGSVYNSQRASINDSQETLVTLAEDTGGKAFLDSNDLAARHQEAQQDAMGSYYILGYYTDQLSRRRQIPAHYRQADQRNATAQAGASPRILGRKPGRKMNGQDKEQQLKEAIAAGDPITDMPLALQVDYFRVSPAVYFVPVSVKVPGSVVALAAKGGAAFTQFDFLGQIQDESKAVVGNVRDFIKIKLDEGTPPRPCARTFSTTPDSRWSRDAIT